MVGFNLEMKMEGHGGVWFEDGKIGEESFWAFGALLPHNATWAKL